MIQKACGCIDYEVGPPLRCSAHFQPRSKHTALRQLEYLAEEYSAKLTIVVDYSNTVPFVSTTFKRPRHAAEKVTDRGTIVHGSRFAPSTDSVLEEVLKRLGYHRLPTIDNIVERMTPSQKARVRELIKEIVAIKHDAAMRIDQLEPRLAPPGCSLKGATLRLGRKKRG